MILCIAKSVFVRITSENTIVIKINTCIQFLIKIECFFFIWKDTSNCDKLRKNLQFAG